jgi:hypothetical protein
VFNITQANESHPWIDVSSAPNNFVVCAFLYAKKNANTRYTTIKKVLTSTAEVVQTAGPSVSWKCSSRWTNLTATSQRPEDKRSKFRFPASQTEEYGNEPSKLQSHMAVCQNLVPLVNIKIAGIWMFIPLKMVLIGTRQTQKSRNHIFFQKKNFLINRKNFYSAQLFPD